MTRAKKYGIWALVLTPVLLLIGLPFGLHFYLKHRVAAYRAELRQQGVILDLKDLIPPPPTNGPNGATEFLLAAGQLQNDYTRNLSIRPMRMVAPGRAIVSWRQPEWIGNSGTNEWPALMRGVAANEKALADIRAAIQQPELRFNVNYLLGLNAPLPQLEPSRKAFLNLHNSVMQALLDNNLAEADASLIAMWRIIQSMKHDRFEIIQRARLAMLKIFHAQFWEYLEHPGVREAGLQIWQNRWQEADYNQSETMMLNYEFVILQDEFKALRRDPTCLGAGSQPMEWDQPLRAMRDRISMFFIWPYFTSYEREREIMESTAVAMNALRSLAAGSAWLTEKQGMTNAHAKIYGRSQKNNLHWFDPMGQPTFEGLCFQWIEVEGLRRMTITAIALKRYRLKHGQYPMELAALVPTYLKEVSLDPMDAKPLRYRLNPDGTFVLYSIGEDGEDNQGDVSIAEGSGVARNWLKGKDWVWPQPATEEQVNAWFAKQRERAR